MSMDITTWIAVVGTAALALFVLWSWKKGVGAADTQRVDQLLSSALAERQKGVWTQQEYLLGQALQLLNTEANPDFTKKSSCLVHLADAYQKQGKLKEAKDGYQQLIQFWKKQLQSANTDRLADFDYFAATADFGGGAADVAAFYQEVVEAKKRAYGTPHAEVSNSMVIYSRLLAQSGQKELAQKIENEARAAV